MKIYVRTLKETARARNIFIPLFQGTSPSEEELFSFLPKHIEESVQELAHEEFRGEEGETKSVWFPQSEIKHVRLFGLGEISKWNWRRENVMPRQLVRYAKSERIFEFGTRLFSPTSEAIQDAARCFATNALLANFDFNRYKQPPKEGWPDLKTIYLGVGEKDILSAEKGIKEGIILGEETNSCRDLVNTPGSEITPAKLAHAAVAAAKRTGMTVKILGRREMEKLGMGGVLGVARGSDEKPKFIILEYRHGPKNQQPLVLVGKGVTFDTGGLNIKPDMHMYEMHMDMSGGAAVIFGMAAIARLNLTVNVIGLVPAVENMPSGSSYRPGDLLKALNGKTIEVLNTDAEGRVILADALAYGQRYKPGLMVDFATLTGAAHVALGHYTSALFTKDEMLQQKLYEVGQRAGDYVWPLPLWDEYLVDIKGTFGDFTNIGKHDRYGGAIHGAKFLEQFAGDTRWAHIDIAPRMTTVESDSLAKGASGVGVRFIVELARAYPFA